MKNTGNKEAPTTPETRNSLYENMGKTIESLSPILKRSIVIEEILDQSIESKEFKISNGFLSLNIFVQYVNIELASVLRACFRANLLAEKRYNIKWINCVILESYKHLYGYGDKRKKSLWVTRVKPLLELINQQDFKQDFRVLENHIVEFGKNNVTNQEQRNLSFHYDSEPLSVYDMLMELSEEKEIQRLIRFMNLLQEISLFISKYIKEYGIQINVEPKSLLKYSYTFSDYDIFQNNKDFLYSTMEDVIRNHSQRLDELIRQQMIPEWLNQQFNDIDSKYIAPIYKLIEIEKVAIQLTYLYIDLASAHRAFFSSEYTIEKQMSLKQVCIIIHGGYNKLYGLDDNLEDSFWEKNIYPVILESKDESINDEFNSIDKELQALKIKIKALDKQRQLFVHLYEGIPKIYSTLHNLNPIKELQNSLLLLNIMPKIINFLTKCLLIINLENQTNHEKRMTSTYEKIDNIISLLRKTPSTRQKEDLIKKLEKFKTGEFLEEIKRKMRNNKNSNSLPFEGE